MSIVRRRQAESGFTVIELLVVMLIVGILGAIAVPIYRQFQEKGAVASVKSDLKNLGTFMEEFIVKNDGRFPTTLPDESFQRKSPNNSFALTEDGRCVEGRNSRFPNIREYYDATTKRVTSEPWCGRDSTPVVGGNDPTPILIRLLQTPFRRFRLRVTPRILSAVWARW